MFSVKKMDVLDVLKVAIGSRIAYVASLWIETWLIAIPKKWKRIVKDKNLLKISHHTKPNSTTDPSLPHRNCGYSITHRNNSSVTNLRRLQLFPIVPVWQKRSTLYGWKLELMRMPPSINENISCKVVKMQILSTFANSMSRHPTRQPSWLPTVRKCMLQWLELFT